MSRLDLTPDRDQREQAETTFDRNVVVLAGAGTGKTTLLVNRLVHLLVKEPHPVPMAGLVALTFTNKAATEMKVRLHERLLSLLGDASGVSKPAGAGAVTADDLQALYGLSRVAIADRAETALRHVEKAQIGTLHSFAAHLLRLHPLECGIDPAFQEDDGVRFDEHFAQAWECWLDRELSRQGSHHDLWRSILRTTSLEEIRTFAKTLCGELVELGPLREQLDLGTDDPRATERLRQVCDRGTALMAAHTRATPRKVEQILAAAIRLLESVADRGVAGVDQLPAEDLELLDKHPGAPRAGWTTADFDEAIRIIRLAKECRRLKEDYFKGLLALVLPVVSDVRESFARQGWLSFDGLLARARALLRDHPGVRERIKSEVRAVLVDEFQDADPVQYEIILSISERMGQQAAAWQEMELEPGKLCVVGDPKQSIYAFRRADIEAFDRVVRKIVTDGGAVFTLTTNFRSDPAVLGPVNDLFDRLFEPQPHLQPPNIRLDGRPGRRTPSVEPGVRIQLVAPADDDETFDTREAARAEAETLARWLSEDLLRRPAFKPGHVALLFRKLTQANLYLDALRRHDLPYVIDGEKQFYRQQEIIELINLLRVLDNPHDQVALVGVLRAPLGGLTDRDIYELRRSGHFDYCAYERLGSWAHPRAQAVQRLYRRLALLHQELPSRPLTEVIQTLFERLPLLQLAAASRQGEQAVANLIKVKHIAAAMADRPSLTLSGFVELLVARVTEQPDEAESPLAEDSSGAIKVLTIHKSKGLEFPVVVLPGLHQGVGRARSRTHQMVAYDWSSGLYGISLGAHRTLGGVFLQETLAAREAAEHRRVLYVGMTRAKDFLLLSGGVTARPASESVLRLLSGTGGGELGSVATSVLAIGDSKIPHRVLVAPKRREGRRASSRGAAAIPLDIQTTMNRWSSRTVAWEQALATPVHVTPTVSGRGATGLAAPPMEGGPSREIARLVGICAHRILQSWNFDLDPRRLQEQIPLVLNLLPGGAGPDTYPAVADSLGDLVAVFGASTAYLRLRRATILGREFPFVIPWDGGQIMAGTIDILYRLDNELWVADFKTDSVTEDTLADRAARHRPQLEIYRTAVQRALGATKVGVELIFLRAGLAVRW